MSDICEIRRYLQLLATRYTVSHICRIISTKLLGLTINDKLTWNDNVEDLVKRSSKKMYFLVQLERVRVLTADLVNYYRAYIRSSLDYACPVFHNALPKHLQIELERVQKRALSCILPREHY